MMSCSELNDELLNQVETYSQSNSQQFLKIGVPALKWSK